MKRNLMIFCSAILIAALAAGCVKVIPKFDSNTIAVTFNAPTAIFLTADRTVNPKDSIAFSYSVSSPTPMANVYLYKNGTPVYSDSVKTSGQLTFSGIRKFVADSAAGQYQFQVVAKDAQGIYLGSSNSIIVTVTSDFYNYVGRRLYVPDTTTKTNPCFINLATGTTYSYNDVVNGNNSAQVDLGLFFNTDTVNTSSSTTSPVKTPVGISFYAPGTANTVSPNQRKFYDFSTWTTKNATLINIATTPTYASLLSGGGLKSAGVTNLKTNYGNVPNYTALTPTSQTSFKAIAAGSLIFFKTVAGKYGVININYVNQTNATRGTYVNFDYKIQK